MGHQNQSPNLGTSTVCDKSTPNCKMRLPCCNCLHPQVSFIVGGDVASKCLTSSKNNKQQQPQLASALVEGCLNARRATTVDFWRTFAGVFALKWVCTLTAPIPSKQIQALYWISQPSKLTTSRTNSRCGRKCADRLLPSKSVMSRKKQDGCCRAPRHRRCWEFKLCAMIEWWNNNEQVFVRRLTPSFPQKEFYHFGWNLRSNRKCGVKIAKLSEPLTFYTIHSSATYVDGGRLCCRFVLFIFLPILVVVIAINWSTIFH